MLGTRILLAAAVTAAFPCSSIAQTSATSPSPPPSAPASVRQIISAEDFGALPFLSRPKLSPDAKRVLATTYVDGKRRLTVLQLDNKTTKVGYSFALGEDVDLVWYRWAGDNRILISVGDGQTMFGEDVYVTRLLMYDLETGKVSRIGKRDEGIEGDNVIHVDREGRWLLLSVQSTIYDYPSVWRVDLATLKMQKIVSSSERVWDWYADSSGTVRAGVGVNKKTWWLLYRKDADARFERVVQRKITEDEEKGAIERFVPIDGSDAGFAVSNQRTGRYGLYRYDFATDTIGSPIFEHPKVDIDDFLQSEQGDIEAIYYTDDRSHVEWLNPKMKELQAELDQALPDRINRVISFSRDNGTMIVWTAGASDPGAFYYYHRAGGTMSLLARPYEKLRGKQLAQMQATSYVARDGLEIPAYLTLPSGREPRQLPLVIMPHGGPYVRDEWGYEARVQFLANLGYVVLQPNFRGSTGYGAAFVEKGHGQWGRSMQDDLDDGVKWLVDSGTVDPKRVCIMGASYGGYAAMWAAARNPEIYRCAISFAGVSDLKAQIRYDRKAFSAARYHRAWREKIQGEESFDIDTVSPLYAASRIEVPLLIAHGDKDKTVPLHQSRKMHEALTKANKPHSYVVYQGEGHGFQSPANAVDFLKRMETFLRTHNPPD